jgi:hypothetical protein
MSEPLIDKTFFSQAMCISKVYNVYNGLSSNIFFIPTTICSFIVEYRNQFACEEVAITNEFVIGFRSIPSLAEDLKYPGSEFKIQIDIFAALVNIS